MSSLLILNGVAMLTVRSEDVCDGKPKVKALVLLSGGLDSLLAAKLISDQGIGIDVVNFATPFCLCDHCSVDRFVKELDIKVHRVYLGQDFLDIVVNPPHGHGSQMNPCMDCRILMLKKAKELMKTTGAEFIVTGEVLNERPFSQRKEALLHIEKDAGLEGRILRPLSGNLLPETIPEKKGWIDKQKLLSIEGRRRLPQIDLARKIDIKNYPCPSGGCLLTDPRFAQRLKEHLQHDKGLTLQDVFLLKIGRHFRLGETKIIVGRNEEENNRLLAIAKNREMSYLEAVDYEGPVTLYLEKEKTDFLEKSAAITVRYSDAPKDIPVRVLCRISSKELLYMDVTAVDDKEIVNLRI